MTSFVADILTNLVPPAVDTVPRKLGNYRYLVSQHRNSIYRNAMVYANRRTESRRFPNALIKRVFAIATFIPASSNRYTAGDFVVERLKYVVIHRIGWNPPACTLVNAIRNFVEPSHNVSTHFIVGLNGEIIQMVDLADKSNHCGGSNPPKNSDSVGIELEGAVGDVITGRQYIAMAKIIRLLYDLTGFLPNPNLPTFIVDARPKILGHSEINQDKQDPGYNMNYSLLLQLVQNTPPTARGSIFRPAFDPTQEVESSIQAMMAEATNPGSQTEMSVLASAMASGNAMQRAALFAMNDRSIIASTAVTSSQNLANFLSEKLAAQERLANAIAVTPIVVPENYAYYLDYTTGRYEGV